MSYLTNNFNNWVSVLYHYKDYFLAYGSQYRHKNFGEKFGGITAQIEIKFLSPIASIKSSNLFIQRNKFKRNKTIISFFK